MTISLVITGIQKHKTDAKKEQKDPMVLTKMPRLNLFLNKTLFTCKLSELLRDEFSSFESKIRGICAKPHTSAKYCTLNKNQNLIKTFSHSWFCLVYAALKYDWYRIFHRNSNWY